MDKYEKLKNHYDDLMYLADLARENMQKGIYSSAARYMQAIMDIDKQFKQDNPEDE